jgi:hypothetical protein
MMGLPPVSGTKGVGMLFLDDSAFSRSFNSRAVDLKIAQLTEDMTQAFYRREHETIDLLAAKGASFTEEMLQISVAFRDHHLADKCMTAGVIPNAEMVKRAVDQRDVPLVDMLMKKIEPTDELKTYIERFASDDVQKIAAPTLARVPKPPAPSVVPEADIRRHG